MLRRLGYVRLRDYNLRATKDGTLVPISADRFVPLELDHPALAGAFIRPALPLPPTDAALWPPEPPMDLAEGTVDGLEKVGPTPNWASSDASVPPPHALARFGGGDEDDELPYRPWTEES